MNRVCGAGASVFKALLTHLLIPKHLKANRKYTSGAEQLKTKVVSQHTHLVGLTQLSKLGPSDLFMWTI